MRDVTLLWVAAITVFAFGVSTSSAEQSLGAAVEMIPADQPFIDAEILFLDTGDPASGLIVSGVAKGLDPTRTYVSLIYPTGSVNQGPKACLPTNSILEPDQMFVGQWSVAKDGSGRLFAAKLGKSFASLKDVGTVSVRVVENSTRVLQACGFVERAEPVQAREKAGAASGGTVFGGTSFGGGEREPNSDLSFR